MRLSCDAALVPVMKQARCMNLLWLIYRVTLAAKRASLPQMMSTCYVAIIDEKKNVSKKTRDKGVSQAAGNLVIGCFSAHRSCLALATSEELERRECDDCPIWAPSKERHSHEMAFWTDV